jgi:hypothetical protein
VSWPKRKEEPRNHHFKQKLQKEMEHSKQEISKFEPEFLYTILRADFWVELMTPMAKPHLPNSREEPSTLTMLQALYIVNTK